MEPTGTHLCYRGYINVDNQTGATAAPNLLNGHTGLHEQT